jgi:hypothetical protein
LLDAEDLPGSGWLQRSQKAWRVGALGEKSPRGQRAHELGLFMAVRSFEQTDTGSWFVDQVAQLASTQDAAQSVAIFSIDTMWANPRFRGTHLDEQEANGPSVAGVDSLRAFQWRTEGPDGAGFVRLIEAAVGSVWILLIGFRSDRFWKWDEFVPILDQHASRYQN